ncbi:MAG: Alternative oxidase, mitochondrial precursor, partial [Tremellales sp. Tagirdzhanova-0007]
DYWRLPESATLLDVMRAVRADEATHRFVNHSLANLDQKRDFNPFALGEASADIRGTKYGFTRQESAEFATKSQQKLMKQAQEEAREDSQRIAQ